MIYSYEENEFVKNMVIASGETTTYIGLTDEEVENTWKWVKIYNCVNSKFKKEIFWDIK